jgi:hypothetical protein
MISNKRKKFLDGVDDETIGSKTRRVDAGIVTALATAVVAVTPAIERNATIATGGQKDDVRRTLFQQGSVYPVVLVTEEPTPAKRKLLFGRFVTEAVIQENTQLVYRIIKKLTNSIGGNAAGGPIYGELTCGSMQKIIDLMKEHTDFDSKSRFIDVGSGIGKPNLHVAQDPGVEFSYGIEVDSDRWLLGMSCLKGVLDAALSQPSGTSTGALLGHNCVFEKGDIRGAKTFDPFTHVYMFSIGFPPSLWLDLADIWNRSSSMYLICYHSPRDIIKNYEFEVELVAQRTTSMHGSKESHMGYIYKRTLGKTILKTACDPLFKHAWKQSQEGLSTMHQRVTGIVAEKMTSGPSTRTRNSAS